jgi:butyrate kinase
VFKILAINPGSTSTKIGIFEDEKLIHEANIHHSAEELRKYTTVDEEIQFRHRVIVEALDKAGIDVKSLSAIGCRGGLVRPVPGGTYLVNEALLHDSRYAKIKHPCNLAALIGHSLGEAYGIKSYITDPPITFEAEKVALVSGCYLIPRPQTFHALNHKAIAKKHCRITGKKYEDVTLIVAHFGGGISIGVHHQGRVIDVTDALSEGPFTPERAGNLPTVEFADLCFDGKYDRAQIQRLLRGDAGFQGYLGTTDMREIVKMIEAGDEKAKFYFDAFIYQVGKDIGAMATVKNGKIDAILLTGGIAHNQMFVDRVIEKVGWIAPVFVYPGQEELQALNLGVLAVLQGKETAKTY